MKVVKHKISIAFYQFRRLNFKFFKIFVLSLIFLSLVSAQETSQNNQTKDNLNYKIGVGDVLKIVVLKQQILSQEDVRVDNAGTIRLPMIEGNISALCLTEAELSEEIAKRYKKYILNPQVYVSVKEFNAYPVAVVGAVNSPGTFQLKRPMRILNLLTYVNGPSANAGQNVQIIRSLEIKRCEQPSEKTKTSNSEQEELIFLSLAEILKGNETANLFVEPGDIIRITEAEIKQAFIIGNVRNPTVINLKEPVTLSKAVAMAGGFSEGARIDKIKIVRQNPDSLTTTEILVNLKEAGKNNQEDLLLQPNDIIEVPGPKPPSLWKKIFQGILPTILRAPVLIP